MVHDNDNDNEIMNTIDRDECGIREHGDGDDGGMMVGW